MDCSLDQTVKQYTRKILFQNDYFEVIECQWKKFSLSPLHGHDWSSCFFSVQSGTFEESLHLGIKTEINILQEGDVTFTPSGAKHEIKCMTETGTTLHLYTPKLTSENEKNNLIFSEITHNISHELNDSPTEFKELLFILKQIQRHSISTHSPYFMNQLFSGVLPEVFLAENILAQTKTTMATKEASPIFSKLEIELIDKLCELIKWPSQRRNGITVPGGSSSNFMALHCARQNLFPQMKKTGLDKTKFAIFISEDAHYSFEKASMVLGFGTNSLKKIKVDSFGKMNLQHLKEAILNALDTNEIPLCVCATAGTTVYGAFDPLMEIADICKKHGIWLHVDAAWGGPVLFSDKQKHLLNGINLADSVTFDAHKLFGASLTCSLFLTAHPTILQEANSICGGQYLFHDSPYDVDRGHLSWQCGRKADFFSFWTIWKHVGTTGLGAFVDRLYELRDRVIHWVQNQSRICIVKEPEYVNLCLKISPPSEKQNSNEWSKKVRHFLLEKNIAMVNYMKNEDSFFLRLIFVNPFLEFEHVETILTNLLDFQG